MKKLPRKRPLNLDDRAQQKVAMYIVANPNLTIKQIAFDLGIPYLTVWKIMRERVNISKVLTLRYPPTADSE